MTSMMIDRRVSEEVYEQLCRVIPGGVNSPVRSFPGLNQTPIVVESGAGSELFDVDGIAYLDFCCSWGALLHGHAHKTVTEAVVQRLQKGSSFGTTSAVEEKLARFVVSHLDSVEKIRFVSSGSEATMAAVRLARGYTQRETVVKFTGNYHGSADQFLVKAGSGLSQLNQEASSAGVPNAMVKKTVSLPYNDIEACSKFFADPQVRSDIAAVIIEPIAGNMGVVPASPGFLNFLREETEKMGALLIFDEVITGFRVGMQGAQGIYGITPDLSCFGKIIGGGFPAAAFGGKKEIMDCLAPLGSVYQAGTLSGNPVAMEAGYQTLMLADTVNFYENLEKKTAAFIHPIKQALIDWHEPACIQRVGSMFTLFFGKQRVSSMDDAQELNTTRFAEFFRYLFERGVYFPPSQFEACFISSAHSDEQLQRVQEIILSFFT